MEIWPGRPYPLGATYDGSGTNFALFSEVAEGVELCLFDDDGVETRVAVTEADAHVWHCYLPSAQPGQRYGYRVHGTWDPENGKRCNPNKLLLDPYAKAVDSDISWDESLFTYRFEDGPDGPLNDDDSGQHMAKGVVINPFFDWDGDRAPRTSYADSIIYEAHVKGITYTHPDIPEEIRGTYAAVAHPVMLEHYKKIGITAIELMPVHEFAHDSHLAERGLRNYWGYNTLAFLAPHHGYSAHGTQGQQVAEFKGMVRDLHANGLEVILDVVYNHTAEGNHAGPMLSMRGIDNEAYYRLVEDDKKFYMDTTGTGNSLWVRHPHTLQLIMDSLRYWVTEMHVDGFRFDLASTLAREFHEVDRLSAFFDLVQQDPVVSQVKLIAEPWDIGDNGYNVGQFPPLWTEWNGKFRDTVRDFWRGEQETVPEFAERLTGSSDLYQGDGRRPVASINFVTAHDGMTIRDLVSYNEKHNDANGENGNDGEDHNRSWNCGVEGETDDQEVLDLRHRQERNLLTTLILAQGVPMLLHGDELGRTQGGNNNVYAQDSEIAWIDWADAVKYADLQTFVGRLTALRSEHPTFRRRRFFQGSTVRGSKKGDVELPDVMWLRTDGEPMSDEDWDTGYAQTLAMVLNGEGIMTPGLRGEKVVDDHFCLLFNSYHEDLDLTLPGADLGPGVDGRARLLERHRRVGGGLQGRRDHLPAAPLHAGPAVHASVITGTYRLQLHGKFTFDDAVAVLPYVASLGVSHVYCSPWLQSAAGSTHGYDVVDHTRVDSEIGGPEGLARFVAACRAEGLGIVLDLVPNHMGVDAPEDANAVWTSALATGPEGPHGQWFDIETWPVVVPVLGDDTENVTVDGDVVRYHEHVFPLAGQDRFWRLESWEGDGPTYRRFFDVTTLAGIRVEDQSVFDASHALILSQIADGTLDGLRIDHPDGLADPGGYLDKLAAGVAATGRDGIWTVVEKILEPGETLQNSWKTAGTTGYERPARPHLRAARPLVRAGPRRPLGRGGWPELARGRAGRPPADPDDGPQAGGGAP